MSGTSLDAIDAVVVDFKGALGNESIIVEAFDSIRLPKLYRQQVTALSLPDVNELNTSANIGRQWTELTAQLVSRLLSTLDLHKQDIVAIGAHGQTIRHEPPSLNSPHPYSLQAINAPLLAEMSEIDVITDFRNRDIAAGGEGAPLAPGFHLALFSQLKRPTILINLGGIANLSYIDGDQTFGFDTGPANILMDGWCQRHQNELFDRNGHWAKQGKADQCLLNALMAHPFIKKEHPKSTGREAFNLEWLDEILTGFNLSPETIQATLLEFTVSSISDAIKKLGNSAKDIYLCGGGAYNPASRSRRICLASKAIYSQTSREFTYGYRRKEQAHSGSTLSCLTI